MIVGAKESFDENKSIFIAPELKNYMIDNLNRISEIKKELRKETQEKYPKSSIMMTSIDEAELLKMFIKAMNAKKGIEVGYSALCFGEGLAENGKLIALDVNEEWGEMAKKYWKAAGIADKIELVIGPAIESLNKLVQDEKNLESFDFAYIDADKENYINYYELLLKLIRKGGVVIFDNIFLHGSILKKEEEMSESTKGVYQAGKFLRNDERVDIATVGVADGILFAYKK